MPLNVLNVLSLEVLSEMAVIIVIVMKNIKQFRSFERKVFQLNEIFSKFLPIKTVNKMTIN